MQQQNCFLCGKEISWLRLAVDRQYCSDEHRKEARLAATSVLQEEEEETDLWSVSKNKQKKARAAQSQSTPAYILFALGAVILVMAFTPNNNGGRPSSGGAISLNPAKEKGGLIARANGFFAAVIRERAPVTLRHDFTKGLRDWNTSTVASASGVDDPHDWKRPSSPSFVQPGSIRLWARSIPMRNYQMDFQGQIQKRSLSWAFRASDAKNYYAAKIVITKPGPLPNAGLVHYVVLDGHERDRIQLPLPITLERGENYRVRVAVQDNRFITYLNGQVISSWRDDTLTRGGIGFFSDRDDEQKVSWVSLSERDSFLGQMLSHFTLFVLPQMRDVK